MIERALRVKRDEKHRRVASVDSLIWEALQQVIYRPCHIWDAEHLKEVLQTCWEQIGQDVIDRAIGQLRKRLLFIVAAGGGHIEHRFD